MNYGLVLVASFGLGAILAVCVLVAAATLDRVCSGSWFWQ